MAAPPLVWKEEEGTDIHLLRGGPESKRLVDSLDLESGQAAFVAFVPNLQGSDVDHGVELRADVGIVKAKVHQNPDFPRVANFLVAAVFDDGSGHSHQTEIRIHVHDTVKDIWLTPPSLSLHQGADECRFTVLARFNDDCVGDITDWPGLTFQSSDESVVKVLSTGVLQAVASSGSASITVTLTLASPSISKTSVPARALAKPSWADVAKAARVEFVAGRIVPNKDDPDSTEPDSVKSTVERAKNILFIAEGFRNDQRFDYRNIVNTIARVMRGEEAAFTPAFQPFPLLKDSINFWTVFVASEQDGISVLGEHLIAVLTRLIGVFMQSQPRPAADALEWYFRELFHEVGMPLKADATRTVTDLVSDWQKLFGPHVTEARVLKAVNANWKLVSFHSPLNERDTVFGMAHGYRPFAAQEFGDVVDVLLSPRRVSRRSIQEFLANLSVGGFPIGARWASGGADDGLVCIVCLCDRNGGVRRGRDGFFAVTTGRSRSRVDLKDAPDSGFEIQTGPVISTRRHLLASTVCHELGHALQLGDEYGDGAGTGLLNGSDTVPVDPNLQAKIVVAPPVSGPASPPPPPVYDPKKIRWLWPRITGAGVLVATPTTANISTADIRIPLLKGHSRNFAVGDVVRFRRWPNLLDGHFDLFVDGLFRVKAIDDDAVKIVPVSVTAGSNATTDIAMSSFDSSLFLIRFSAGERYTLIRPHRVKGVESKLIAEPILKHIETSRGPLNAPKDDPTEACVIATDSGSIMTPTNLPDLSRVPRTKADIVGIYEGGSLHDCGVFRPAGRCRMRGPNVVTTPFCHVCRFLMVELVDPTRHGELDKLYPEVST